MINKICEFCKKPFATKDRRQKNCNATCAQNAMALRLSGLKVGATPAVMTPTPPVAAPQPAPVKIVEQVTTMKLPPPEELPAPYAKRVHDMWAALVGSSKDTPTRIA